MSRVRPLAAAQAASQKSLTIEQMTDLVNLYAVAGSKRIVRNFKNMADKDLARQILPPSSRCNLLHSNTSIARQILSNTALLLSEAAGLSAEECAKQVLNEYRTLVNPIWVFNGLIKQLARASTNGAPPNQLPNAEQGLLVALINIQRQTLPVDGQAIDFSPLADLAQLRIKLPHTKEVKTLDELVNLAGPVQLDVQYACAFHHYGTLDRQPPTNGLYDEYLVQTETVRPLSLLQPKIVEDNQDDSQRLFAYDGSQCLLTAKDSEKIINRNVADIEQLIQLKKIKDDDNIFISGFSRGAWQAVMVALALKDKLPKLKVVLNLEDPVKGPHVLRRLANKKVYTRFKQTNLIPANVIAVNLIYRTRGNTVAFDAAYDPSLFSLESAKTKVHVMVGAGNHLASVYPNAKTVSAVEMDYQINGSGYSEMSQQNLAAIFGRNDLLSGHKIKEDYTYFMQRILDRWKSVKSEFKAQIFVPPPRISPAACLNNIGELKVVAQELIQEIGNKALRLLEVARNRVAADSSLSENDKLKFNQSVTKWQRLLAKNDWSWISAFVNSKLLTKPQKLDAKELFEKQQALNNLLDSEYINNALKANLDNLIKGKRWQQIMQILENTSNLDKNLDSLLALRQELNKQKTSLSPMGHLLNEKINFHWANAGQSLAHTSLAEIKAHTLKHRLRIKPLSPSKLATFKRQLLTKRNNLVYAEDSYAKCLEVELAGYWRSMQVIMNKSLSFTEIFDKRMINHNPQTKQCYVEFKDQLKEWRSKFKSAGLVGVAAKLEQVLWSLKLHKIEQVVSPTPAIKPSPLNNFLIRGRR